ncbi:tripartite motif-containing protein 2-like [Ptychodera flava]|uniref:tripartite motif-containing protein 2-like n=1 Tax=Ptychodera flava TaxID=63121 RepID=UPI003969FDEA
MAIEVLNQDELIVSDFANKTVIICDLEGKVKMIFWDEDRLKRPCGIVSCDRKGVFYISDITTNCIQVFSRYGSFRDTMAHEGDGDGEVLRPCFMARNSRGSIIIADNQNNRVQVYDKDGKYSHKFGQQGDADGEFQHPRGIALDKSDNIFVTSDDKVQMFTPDGQFICRVDAAEDELNVPRGVVVTSDDPYKVIVTDSQNHRVVIFKQKK